MDPVRTPISPTYPIRTERLLLRPLDPVADVDAVHAYQSIPDVCRYVPYSPLTREQVADRLGDPGRTRSEFTTVGDVIDLAIVRQEDGRLIGDLVVFWHSDVEKSGEIGYAMHPDAYGHGYATEAAQAGLAIAFDVLGLHRVTGSLDARNTASANVLRRLGMRHEATSVEAEWFKDEWSTSLTFALLDREWRAQNV